MADNSVLDQLFTKQYQIEVFAHLWRKSPTEIAVEYSFRPQEKESIINSEALEDFLLDLEDIIKDFKDETKLDTIDIKIRLLKIREIVIRKYLREFFNAMVFRMTQDGLDAYAELKLKEFHLFPDNNALTFTEDDELSIKHLEKLIETLRLFKTLPTNSSQQPSSNEQTKKDEDQQQKERGDKGYSGGSSGPFSFKKSTAQSRVEAAQEAYQNQNAPQEAVTIDAQKVFRQEIIRETNIVEIQFLGEFLLKDLKIEHLPDNLREIIQGKVSEELTKHFDKYFVDGSMNASTRISLLATVLGELNHDTMFQPLFEMYREKMIRVADAPKEVKAAFTKKQFSAESIDAIVAASQQEETENNLPKSYSLLAKEQFKDEIKRIVILSQLTSEQSLDSMADALLKEIPDLAGKGFIGTGVDPLKIRQIVGLYTKHGVNLDTQNKLLDTLNKHLIAMGTAGEQLKKLTTSQGQHELKKQLKDQIGDAFVAVTIHPEDLDRAVNQMVEKFRDVERFDEITVEKLREAMPSEFADLLPEDRELIEGKILALLRTGTLSVINPKNIDSVRVLAWLKNKDPNQALQLILKAYSIDPTDVSAKRLFNLLDAYSLSSVSAQDLQKHIGVFLNRIDPRLTEIPELYEFLKSYVVDRKQNLAEYTKNAFVQYSADEADSAEVAQVVSDNNVMISKFGTDVTALAEFAPPQELLNVDGIDELERQKRDLAWRLRQAFIQQQEVALKEMSDKEREEIGTQYGIDPNLDPTAYNTALANAMADAQDWSAPNAIGPDGSSGLGGWLNRAKSFGKIKNLGLQNLVKKELLKKAAIPLAAGGAGAAGGIALATQLFGTAQGVLVGSGIGGVLGGIGGGFAGGFLIGGPFGAAIGAFTGGLLGAVGGGAVGGALSGGGGPAVGTAIQSGTSELARQVATTASTGAKVGADVFAKTVIPSQATIPTTAVSSAIAAPTIATYIFTTISITMILAAFLPDASTIQVAPSFTTDIVESRYITVRKTADPVSAATPQSVHYRVEISKKPDVSEEIVIGRITDTLSAINQDLAPVNTPPLPQSAIDAFAALEGKTLDGTTPMVVEFDVDATSQELNNSLLKNDIKVSFTASGSPEEANARAQTCFGDCPQTVVPACWPVDSGTSIVTQVPYGRGPKSNPDVTSFCINHPGYSHCGGITSSSGAPYHPDAYDIGSTPTGTEIYAAAPGKVIKAGWDTTGYGNLVAIDHGTFIAYYAHMSQMFVPSCGTRPDPPCETLHEGQEGGIVGGQPIGLVGSTGNSSGPHLHYEIIGLNEFVLLDTLGGEMNDRVGIRCDEYYGR